MGKAFPLPLSADDAARCGSPISLRAPVVDGVGRRPAARPEVAHPFALVLAALALAAVLVAPLVGSGAPLAGHAANGERPVDAGTIVVQFPSDADASVDSARPTTPLGASTALTIGHGVGPQRATLQTLVHFPLPDLPPGSTIVSATLLLDVIGVRGQAEVEVRCGVLDRAWTESEVTWSSRPPAADSHRIGLVGPGLGPLAVNVTGYVVDALASEVADVGFVIAVDESDCDAGRLRVFASRETPEDDGIAPRLHIAYVGRGTPHPDPSATPTERFTDTPTPTPGGPSPMPSPSATTTSTFGLWQGQATPRRPSDGARLPQPLAGEEWAFEWSIPNRGPCAYVGARVTLIDPSGTVRDAQVTGTCYRFRSDDPVPGGRWEWEVHAVCAHGPTSPSERRTFVVAAAPASPSATAAPTPAATPTPAPVHAPYAGRNDVRGGT